MKMCFSKNKKVLFVLATLILIILLAVLALVFSTSAESTVTVGYNSDNVPIEIKWHSGDTVYADLIRNAGGIFAISQPADFYALQLYYEREPNPQALNISITNNSNISIDAELHGETFSGIGSQAHPFNGSIAHPSGIAYGILLNGGGALFNYLSTSATFTQGLYIQNGGLAKVLVIDTATADYSGITINIGGNISYAGDAGAFAGSIKSGTSTTLALALPSMGFPASITSVNGDAGGVIGSIQSGTDITLTGIPASISSNINATAEATGIGGAGGLVGRVSGSLTINGGALAHSGVLFGHYSGALIGLITGENGSFTQAGTELLTVSGNSVTATYAAGGLIGKFDGASVSLAKVAVSGGCSVIGADYCGGLVGYSKAFDIVSDVTVGSSDSSFVTVNGTKSTGGIIGYIDDESGVATIQPANAYIAVEGVNAGVSGGLIGTVNAKRVTCSVISISQSNSRTDNDNNGTLVGTVSANTIFDCGSITLSGSATTLRAIGTTGVKSVVRFSGTLSYTGSIKAQYIVGAQNNSLIYCESGWSLARNATARDDIGNYGQIYVNSAIGNIITYSDASNTVTVAALPSSSVSDVSDFAKLSIYLSTHGNFGGVTGCASYTDALAEDYSVSGIINLVGTGIESLTRTDTASDAYSGNMTGSSDCNIELNIGSVYPYNATTPNGYYNRSYAGLFAAVNGAGFNSLTISGGIYCAGAGASYAGGIAGYALGNVRVSSVTVSEKIKEKGNTSYYGGMFGLYSGEVLFVTSCTSSAAITLSHSEGALSSVTGGFIGKATVTASADFSGSSFTGSITSDNHTYTNSQVGGFVAILDGGANDATVDLDAVTASGSVIAKSSGMSGGLIGYEWTNVNISLAGTATGAVSASGGTFGGLFHTVIGKLTLQSGFSVSGSYIGVFGGLIVYNGESLYMAVRCADTFSSGVTTSDGITDRLVATNTVHRGTGDVFDCGGIVSIETGGGIGAMPASTSGWYSLPANGNTRYYYNIEALDLVHGGAAGDGEAARLLLWHICNFANAKPLTYFGEKASSYTANGDMNLSGLCFYPTTASGIYNLEGYTLTFGLPAVPDTVEISNPSSQYYGVQTGLLLDVGDGETVIRNGTITGTVNRLSDSGGSGAAIVGTVTGYKSGNSVHTANLTIESLILTSLSVNGNVTSSYYAPLLINKIYEYVTLSVSGITDKTAVVSATSLIGDVGYTGLSGTAEGLILSFSDMVLHTESSNTVITFSKASFLNSLKYSSGNCVYNFNRSEDWSGTAGSSTYNNNVTYGSEMGSTTQYYDEGTAVITDASVTDFTSWLVYIAEYGGSVTTISINLKGGDLLSGYGKYSAPYIITGFNQLYAIARYINTGECDATWKINYPIGWTDFITSVTPSEITVSGSGYEAQIRSYLQGAYYNINFTGSADDSASFIEADGIGTDANPFHGVIYGSGTLNFAAVAGKAGWGFVKVADGCVIKGITIHYTETCTVINDTYYFGGVIGKIIGGDNIIDNVGVTFAEDKSLSITPGKRISYAGGYVGVISSGGVIFRGTVASSMDIFSTAIADYSTYFYANPYIGRVYDGFAVYDGAALPDNGNKNYFIWSGVGTSTVALSGTQVTLSSGYDLMLFSSALNSGNLTTAGYIARKGAYNNIGSSITTALSNSDEYDTSGNTYLIDKMGVGARNSGSSYTVVLGGNCDVSGNYNGFRGLGGMYNGPTLTLAGMSGTYKITMNRNISQYSTEDADTTHQSVTALGLFNKLTLNGAIGNVIIGGTVSLVDYLNTDGTPLTYSDTKVGGLIGSCNKKVTLSNVKCESLTVYSQYISGGIVGECNSGLDMTDCSFDGIKIEGYICVGGLIGKVSGASNIHESSGVALAGGLILYNGNGMNPADSDVANTTGAGGFIGYSGGALNFNMASTDTTTLTVTGVAIMITGSSTREGKQCGFGGVIGKQSGATNITKVAVSGIYIQGYGTEAVTDNTHSFVDKTRIFDYSNPDSSAYADHFNRYLHGLMEATQFSETASTFYNISTGGIVGSFASSGATGQLTGVSVTNSILYTADNCGGLTGDTRMGGKKLTIDDCHVSDTLIVGGTRGVGLVSYISATTIEIKNSSVSDSKIYGVYRNNTRCAAVGVIGEAQSNSAITLSNVEISGCELVGANIAAGLIGKADSSGTNVTVNGATVSNCKMYQPNLNGNCYGSAGIIGSVNSSNVYLNRVQVSGCTLLRGTVTGKSGNNCYTSGLIGYVANAVNIYGNEILLYENTQRNVADLGAGNRNFYSVFIGFPESYIDNAYSGIWFGKLSAVPNVRIIGASVYNTDAGNDLTKEIGSGTATPKIVYASYGTDTASEIFGTPTYNTDWTGDSFGTVTVDGIPTRTALLLDSLPWWKADYSGMTPNITEDIVTYNDTKIGGYDYLDIPMFFVNETETNITTYLDLLTNGGFSGWDGTKSVLAKRYAVTDTGLTEISGDSGSVSWNDTGNVFEKTSSYDSIGQLTLVSVTFTNKKSGKAGDNATYTLDVAVFFPQVLAYWTNIIQLDREEYFIDDFIGIDKTDRSIVVTPNQLFTFYIEYIYNEIGDRTDSYLVKSLENGTENSIPAGTKLMLIDLNTVDYGKVHYKTLETATKSVLFDDFSNSFQNIDLNDLPKLNEFADQPIIGLDGNTSNLYGIERYIIVMVLPTGSVQDNGSALFYDFYANASSESITLENNDTESLSDRFAQVQAWAETTITLATSVRNLLISRDVPIEIDVTATIRYSIGYQTMAQGLGSERYAFMSLYATKDSQLIQLPLGTKINYPDLSENLIASAENTHNYTVTIDLSAVSEADYRDFVNTVGSFRINIIYYLVNSRGSTQSEVKRSVNCSVDLSIDKYTPLTVTVKSENTLSLGINKYESTAGRIEFELKADLINLKYSAGDTLTFKLDLIKKVVGEGYTQAASLDRFTLTSTTAGVTVNKSGDSWSVSIPSNPTAPGYTTNIDILFVLTVDLSPDNPGDTPRNDVEFVNHKLNVELIRENNTVNPIVKSTINSDYFIFTVTNIYTQID